MRVLEYLGWQSGILPGSLRDFAVLESCDKWPGARARLELVRLLDRLRRPNYIYYLAIDAHLTEKAHSALG